MAPLVSKRISLLLVIVMALAGSGCIARFFMGEAAGLRLAAGRMGMAEAFVINAERMVIANEAMFQGALRRVFVRNRVLFIRNAAGTLEEVGSVTGRNTALVQGYTIETPGQIYTVRSGRVNVRSSLNKNAHYRVFQNEETGQIVLKQYEQQGYAYVQVGHNDFGWILLSDLVAVSPGKSTGEPMYARCKLCKETGHAKQNVNCSLCKGSGHINCLYCKGSKELPCLTCAKTGQLSCAACLGMGNTSCGFCIGRGYKLDDFGKKSACDDCHSTGKLTCTECNGNKKKECYDCYGKGATTCNQCFGGGFAICYQCYETGYFSGDIQCQQCMGTTWVRIK